MKLATRSTARRSSRRGGALVASLLVVLTLSGVAAAVFSFSLSVHKEVTAQGSRMRALYLAESAVNEAVQEVTTAIDVHEAIPISVGTVDAPRGMREGDFWADVVDNGDKSYTITANGLAAGTQRRLEVTAVDDSVDLYDHAIYAGNSSGDKSYELRLSGTGKSADYIEGDIYSGNDVSIEGDSSVDGDVYAAGTISGGDGGHEGQTRATPDLESMHYDVNNDVNVAQDFDSAGFYASNSLGGKAWELPEDDPAHIFRKNPSDRSSETSSTSKDDYFLEDPYESVNGFSNHGDSGHTITLSGIPGQPGVDGTDKVYYVDGNIWIHNYNVLALRLKHEGTDGARVTFVAKGNVYFCDDLVLVNKEKDGIAFIAMKDPDVTDSGNIYFGDPRFGTLSEMHAWLYAENDFYDHNLNAAGSATVDVYGNMTAGNHVSIERDYTSTSHHTTTTVHSKLSVYYDDRIKTGQLSLPGLPTNGLGSGGGLRIASWREVPSE